MANVPPTQKGYNQEYLVAAVFQGQGYLVRRGVPLRYGHNMADATDIDVLGIKFTSPFQPHRIICDCKEKQRSKPYERIFWAKGLANFTQASATYVALPRATMEVINFARSGQVMVLTSEILQEYLTKTYGKNCNPYGMANPYFFEPFYKQIKPSISKNKEAYSILSASKSLYLVDDPYVALNLCMDYLNICSTWLKKSIDLSDEDFDLWRFITADLIVLTSILLLYIASDTLGLSKIERERHIIERLTFGDLSPQKAKSIYALVRELAIESAKSLVPNASRESFDPFELQPIEEPLYARAIAGLVERAIASPFLYLELPQLLDFLLFEQSLQNRPFSAEEYLAAFPSHLHGERLKVARNLLSFLRDFAYLELHIFFPHQDNNLPKVGSQITADQTNKADDASDTST